MILKKVGNLKKNLAAWSMEVKCEPTNGYTFVGCDAELTVQLRDIYKDKYETTTQTAVAYCFKCPVCGTQNLIPYQKVPENVDYLNKLDWLKQAKKDLVEQLFRDASATETVRLKKVCVEKLGITADFLKKQGL